MAGVDNFDQQVSALVGNFVPDGMTFTEADLRRSLSTSQEGTLDDLRSLVIDGLQFNQIDLELLLTRLERPSGAVAWSRLDAVAREQAVADSDLVRRFNDLHRDAEVGFTFTQAELLNALVPTAIRRSRTASSKCVSGWAPPDRTSTSVGRP